MPWGQRFRKHLKHMLCRCKSCLMELMIRKPRDPQGERPAGGMLASNTLRLSRCDPSRLRTAGTYFSGVFSRLSHGRLVVPMDFSTRRSPAIREPVPASCTIHQIFSASSNRSFSQKKSIERVWRAPTKVQRWPHFFSRGLVISSNKPPTKWGESLDLMCLEEPGSRSFLNRMFCSTRKWNSRAVRSRAKLAGCREAHSMTLGHTCPSG